MRIQELGHEIRRARLAQGLTQAGLASAVGISRPTLNLLENGLTRDLGVRKVLAILDRLGLTLSLQPGAGSRRRDFVKSACVSASVSYKESLTEDELIRALLTGKVPPGRHAHFATLFDEAPVSLLKGLLEQASRWTSPGKLERSLRRLAREVHAGRSIDTWMKPD